MNPYKINKQMAGILLLAICLFSSSCKKQLELDPLITSVNTDVVFQSDATAVSALTAIYAKLSNANYSGAGDLPLISVYAGLSADELTLFNPIMQTGSPYYPAYTNGLTVNNLNPTDFWGSVYPLIYDANAAIEGLNASTALTPVVKQQLLGEAKFFRAFFYFYLVNIYGNVPLAISTDYNVNRLLSRASSDQVYQQIIADLRDAQQMLVSNYVGSDVKTSSSERTTLNKWAATALLARVYLYNKDYPNAELLASSTIANSQYSIVSLANAFLKNNQEAIWQLQPTYNIPTTNTREAYFFVLPAAGPSTSSLGGNPVYLSNYLVTAFEQNDNRKTSWIGNVTANGTTYYYAYKYKNAATGVSVPVTEYNTVLRLGEQYLIRAEARAQQGNITGAQADLNVIRTRAGLPGTGATDKASLLTAILHEGQVELFTEWGHRWFDLKRTNSIDAVMGAGGVTASKGGQWNANWQSYPIPLGEIQKDPNLVQNTGY